LLTARKQFRAATIRHVAKEPDAHKAARQHVQQETAEELLRRQCHEPPLVAMCVVLSTEGDFIVCEAYQPVIGDSHPVRVASQVLKNMLRPAKRRFGVNDPVLRKQRAKKSPERLLLSEWLKQPRKDEFSLVEGVFQAGHELAAEDPAEGFDW
jgi:hypothetical protein